MSDPRGIKENMCLIPPSPHPENQQWRPSHSRQQRQPCNRTLSTLSAAPTDSIHSVLTTDKKERAKSLQQWRNTITTLSDRLRALWCILYTTRSVCAFRPCQITSNDRNLLTTIWRNIWAAGGRFERWDLFFLDVSIYVCQNPRPHTIISLWRALDPLL